MSKYKNRKIVYKGINMDSVLERNAYRRLEFLGVKFEYHKHTFKIMDGFFFKAFSPTTKKLYKSSIPDRHYTPEFLIKDKGREIFIEMKGIRTAAFNIRWDLFRKTLKPNQEAYLIYNIADLTMLIKTLDIKSKIKASNIKL